LIGLGAALLSALCQSATDIGTKAATREAEERLILATEWIVSAVVLSILCLFAYPALLIHPAAAFAELFRPRFWPILLAGSSLNVAAYYFYVRALRLSDASLVAPIVLVTPVFLLVTSPLMVGEHASSIGVIGVVVSVFGSIFLAFSEPGKTRRLSLLAFLRDPGVYAMGITALLWSITANLDKLGVQASAPLLWIALLSIAIAIASIVMWAVLPHQPLRLRSLRYAVVAGATNAVGNASQMYALTVLFVPYVIAIKRMSALFTVIAGGVMLRETIRRRLFAAAIMLIGAILVVGAISKRPESNPSTRLNEIHRSVYP
jgi:drug/metabolite transporter (DMT)-like permease